MANLADGQQAVRLVLRVAGHRAHDLVHADEAVAVEVQLGEGDVDPLGPQVVVLQLWGRTGARVLHQMF